MGRLAALGNDVVWRDFACKYPEEHQSLEEDKRIQNTSLAESAHTMGPGRRGGWERREEGRQGRQGRASFGFDSRRGWGVGGDPPGFKVFTIISGLNKQNGFLVLPFSSSYIPATRLGVLHGFFRTFNVCNILIYFIIFLAQP